MNARSPLARVLGQGAARSGSRHWWHQRLSAATLVPLTLWLMFSLAVLGVSDYARFMTWARAPLNAVLLLCFCVVGLYHMALGLRVVIEDYIHITGLKVALVAAVEVATFVLIVIAAVSVTLILRGAPV